VTPVSVRDTDRGTGSDSVPGNLHLAPLPYLRCFPPAPHCKHPLHFVLEYCYCVLLLFGTVLVQCENQLERIKESLSGATRAPHMRTSRPEPHKHIITIRRRFPPKQPPARTPERAQLVERGQDRTRQSQRTDVPGIWGRSLGPTRIRRK